MRILIGYDGSDYSDYVIEDLSRAGLPDATEAIVLSVGEADDLPLIVDRVSPSPTGYVSPTAAAIERHLSGVLEGAELKAASAAERIRRAFPSWKVTSKAVCGKPFGELMSECYASLPNMIIVGSQGKSALGRLFLGSVSQRLLHESNRTVRIARRKELRERNRVLIAVDGSENAERAVLRISRRAWRSDTEFMLVAVDDPFIRGDSGYVPWNHEKGAPDDSERSREWLDRVVRKPHAVMKAAGLRISESVRWGDAGNMILEEAQVWDADSIILGARGLGRIRRLLLGSVSSYVAAKAKCTVEVVR